MGGGGCVRVSAPPGTLGCPTGVTGLGAPGTAAAPGAAGLLGGLHPDPPSRSSTPAPPDSPSTEGSLHRDPRTPNPGTTLLPTGSLLSPCRAGGLCTGTTGISGPPALRQGPHTGTPDPLTAERGPGTALRPPGPLSLGRGLAPGPRNPLPPARARHENPQTPSQLTGGVLTAGPPSCPLPSHRLHSGCGAAGASGWGGVTCATCSLFPAPGAGARGGAAALLKPLGREKRRVLKVPARGNAASWGCLPVPGITLAAGAEMAVLCWGPVREWHWEHWEPQEPVKVTGCEPMCTGTSKELALGTLGISGTCGSHGMHAQVCWDQ